MKIIFAGTPEIAVPSLKVLLNSHHQVIAVICAVDHHNENKKIIIPPVKKYTQTQDSITLLQINTFDDQTIRKIALQQADILVCFAYGKIFPRKVLEIFPYGGINFHPSALPLLRGPSPIQSAILLSENTLGLTVQKMSEKMDAGPILVQKLLNLEGKETMSSLSKSIADLAGNIILNALSILEKDAHAGTPQDDEKATYCHFITKEMARLDYQKSAKNLECLVRAMYDTPIAYTIWNDKLMRVFHACVVSEWEKYDTKNEPVGKVVGYDKSFGILVKTVKGFLGLQEIQVAGKKRLFHTDFMNGNQSILESTLL